MPQERGTTIEALDYICSMLSQLRLMSQAHRQDMLAYLIDMAHLEARDQLDAVRHSSEIGRDQRDSAA